MSKFSYRKPRYPSDTDYNTNAPSYYDDLARKQGLIEELSHKVWHYDKILYRKLKEVEETLKKYADILDGKIDDFDDIILSKTENWLDENMENILHDAVKIVWFGLTDDGHFMAVIPENWSEIIFDTTNNGNLVLMN